MSDCTSRAVVLLVMQRRGRPLGINAKGVGMSEGSGALNLTVCRETMRSWYSLLQLLVKFF